MSDFNDTGEPDKHRMLENRIDRLTLRVAALERDMAEVIKDSADLVGRYAEMAGLLADPAQELGEAKMVRESKRERAFEVGLVSMEAKGFYGTIRATTHFWQDISMIKETLGYKLDQLVPFTLEVVFVDGKGFDLSRLLYHHVIFSLAPNRSPFQELAWGAQEVEGAEPPLNAVGVRVYSLVPPKLVPYENLIDPRNSRRGYSWSFTGAAEAKP